MLSTTIFGFGERSKAKRDMQQQPFYGGGYPGLGFDVSLGLPQSFSQTSLGSSLQSADLNSPEVFKQNIQTAQSHIVRVQSLARNALAGM